jgi:type I restriction enzyme R subunit
MERLQQMDLAVNALISPDPLRREFLDHVRLVGLLYGAVKPDPAALEFAGRVACLVAIAESIWAKLHPNPVDISGVMHQVREVLDASISGIDVPAKAAPIMDLSRIDFAALAKRFKQSKTRNIDLEVLKAAIRAQLEQLISLNKTRADFLAKFEELVESYNTGSWNIEELFRELLALSRTLTDEQKRHVRENLSEAELTVFDILTRPGPELAGDAREEVKKVAKHLLERLKSLLVLNWRQKAQARAQVLITIKDTLDQGLPRIYTPDVYNQKCAQVFEHVYENYYGEGTSVFSSVA